ncbi:MAG: phosphoribosylglycinamide formyltransferase [Roseiarcus sp.]
MSRVKSGVMISGRGSNMLALIEAARAQDYPAEIALVISDKRDAAGLDKARAAGVEAIALEPKSYPDKDAFEAAIDGELMARDVEIVCLAGYMRILGGAFVERWRGRMINIHPSLLPAYKGLHTHARALADGASEHGCSVHLVTAKLDDGPVLIQARVPVGPGDDAEILAARVLVEEHRIYPLALAGLARELCRARDV